MKILLTSYTGYEGPRVLKVFDERGILRFFDRFRDKVF